MICTKKQFESDIENISKELTKIVVERVDRQLKEYKGLQRTTQLNQNKKIKTKLQLHKQQ